MIITLQYYTTPHHTTALPSLPSLHHPPARLTGEEKPVNIVEETNLTGPGLVCAGGGQTEIKRDSLTVKVPVKSGSAYNIPIWLEPNLPSTLFVSQPGPRQRKIRAHLTTTSTSTTPHQDPR